MEDIPNAVIDIPDERDYKYDIVMGAISPDRVEFPRDRIRVQNQLNSTATRMACTRFAGSHIINGQNILLFNTQENAGIDMWARYTAKKPSATTEGATLQSGLKQFMDEGYISGYARIDSEDSAKQALDSGHFIYTGSLNGDWKSVGDNHIYDIRDDGRIVGHCWIIVAYDAPTKSYIGLNSYGETNGFFSIPERLFGTTFSKYAISPNKEINAFILYKQKIMEGINIESAKTAFTNSFWNGERPTETASREEVAAMVERAYEAIKNGK